jgi:hypothetical protein
MTNIITINDNEYKREDLSKEANQLAETLGLAQTEFRRQKVLLVSIEIGARALMEELTKKPEDKTHPTT